MSRRPCEGGLSTAGAGVGRGSSRGYGGGGSGREPAEGFACDAGAPLMDVDTSFLMTNEYVQLGPQTVTFKTGACDPIGQVEQKLSFMVQ